MERLPEPSSPDSALSWYVERLLALLVSDLATVTPPLSDGDRRVCQAFLDCTADQATFAARFPEIASDVTWATAQHLRSTYQNLLAHDNELTGSESIIEIEEL